MNARVKGELEAAGQACLRVGSSVAFIGREGRATEAKGNAAVLLAWVALEGHADRRRLSALLWPDSDASQARSNLRVLTHRINQRFGCELLVGGEQLVFDPTQLRVQFQDAETVLAELQAGGAERCELLAEAGLEPDAGEELRAWLLGAQGRLKRLQLARLSEALAAALAVGWQDRAVALARACVQLEPLSEHGHRQLMEVLVRGGDRGSALSAYEECKAMLRQHLGVLPGLQTRAVQLRILQEEASGMALEVPPLVSPAPARSLWPVPAGAGTPGQTPLDPLAGGAPCPLIERELPLGQARAALQQGWHVALQGEPGVGKTRLARQLATDAGGAVETVTIGGALRQEPFAALAQVLQEVQPRRSPAVGVPEQIELARLAPLAFAAVKPSQAALSAPRLHAALRHWWARLAETGMRVLVLDDVQYADAASQAAFAALINGTPAVAASVQPVAPVAPEPALLLGCRSGEADAVLDEALTQAQTRHRARRIELARLSPNGVQALLQAMAPAPSSSVDVVARARHLHRRTGGNPLFVLELVRQGLLRAGRGEDATAVDLGAGANLQPLLCAGLRACSALAQQLAAVAAVAAQAFTVELAAAVAGRDALALMPAWRELQQRGLFAEHGLAHDLVQEAVLASLPKPFLQLLHRQVAQVLEAQGARGAAVLRHWLEADDADRALPHAAHQLDTLNAAGLPTVEQAQGLLGLLERASDGVLMDRLWLTAEVDISLTQAFGASPPWQRLRALRLRVEQLPPRGTSAAWVAFETARDRWHIEGSVKDAYEVLLPALDGVPAQSVERVRVEHALALYAYQLTSEARAHVRRAKAALDGLPQHASLIGLRAMVDTAAAVFLDPVEGLRAQLARWRSARKRGDLGLAVAARVHMAFMHTSMGSAARALRHYSRVAETQGMALCDMEDSHARHRAAMHALDCGHYETAQRLFALDDKAFRDQQALFMALLHLRLGDPAQARTHAERIDPDLPRREAGVLFTHAHVCAELERSHGHDPVPTLQRLFARLPESGVRGTRLARFAWELSLHTQTPADRLEAGAALLGALRGGGVNGGILAKALVEVAETRAAAGAPGVHELANEAARLLRRGYASSTLYLPQGLLRCARLLHPARPREAADLLHVARHWLQQVLPRVPQASRERFAQGVVTNRLLMSADDMALDPAVPL